MSMGETDELLQAIHFDAMEAGRQARVESPSALFGLAWVELRPKKHEFVQWAIREGAAEEESYGARISAGGSFMERQAFVEAYCAALHSRQDDRRGLIATYHTHLD